MHGRFTSVDPLPASATIRNPQSFNRYSYVLNSPYKFSDPLGLLPLTSAGACGQWCWNSAGGGGLNEWDNVTATSDSPELPTRPHAAPKDGPGTPSAEQNAERASDEMREANRASRVNDDPPDFIDARFKLDTGYRGSNARRISQYSWGINYIAGDGIELELRILDPSDPGKLLTNYTAEITDLTMTIKGEGTRSITNDVLKPQDGIITLGLFLEQRGEGIVANQAQIPINEPIKNNPREATVTGKITIRSFTASTTIEFSTKLNRNEDGIVWGDDVTVTNFRNTVKIVRP